MDTPWEMQASDLMGKKDTAKKFPNPDYVSD